MPKLSDAQVMRLMLIKAWTAPGGYLRLYEPDRTFLALERMGLVTREDGGKLTLNGRHALRVAEGHRYE